jgi:streptogramin lyase
MLGRRAFLAGIATGIVAVVGMAAASAASAFIYWADTQNQRIGRANNDGSGVNDSFISTGQLPFAIALDSAHIYWANQNSNSIGRANIDGTGVDNSFIAGVTQPDGVAVTASSIYWSTIGGSIGRADLNGSNKVPSFITGAVEPCGLAVDSGHLYWADIFTGTPAYIGRAGLDGSNKQLTYVTIPGTSFPCGVAVNSSNIFWTDPGFLGGGTRIGRANTNTGSGADPSIIGEASTPCGVALDATHLYWANAGTNTIGRANTDATGVNQSFVVTGANQPCGVAVDGLSSPPVAPPAELVPWSQGGGPNPLQTIVVKGPGKKLAEGRARFSFRSSAAGSTFVCRLDRRKAKACKSPKSYWGLKPGRHSFEVWAIDPAGRRDPTPAKRGFRVPSSA